MILYSIVPAEMVFQGADYLDEVQYFKANYRGESILVAEMKDKTYCIARLLSTHPQSFLNPALQPGNIIDARELESNS